MDKLGFPGGSVVKNLPAREEMWFLSLGSFLGKDRGNPLKYSCLKSPTDRGIWWATVLGVTKESDMT